MANFFQLWRQSRHLQEGTAWAVSYLLPTNLPSFHSHHAQERTHHLPWKNYSHCDNLSPLGVFWLASSPERGAGCLSAHLNSCECLITFFFFKKKLSSCLSSFSITCLPNWINPCACPCFMSLLLLHCPRGGLQPQGLLYPSGMPNLRILGYQWIQPNAKP